MGRLLLLAFLVLAEGCARNTENPAPLAANGPLTPQLVERNNRGVALMGRFEYAQAHDVFSKLVAERPRWTQAKINLAIATLNRQQEGDLSEAQRLLNEVLKTEPENLQALYCLGLLQSFGSAPEEAQEQFERVAQADPHDAFAAYHTGRCLFEAGKYDQALKWYREALERDPYLRSAYYGSFQTLQRLKQPDEAAKMLQAFERLASNPQARLAEQKYTRMGPKALATTASLELSVPVPPVKGPVFATARALAAIKLPKFDEAAVAPSVTVCDIDGDGRLDLFLAAARDVDSGRANIVSLAGENSFRSPADHPLATTTDIRAALWGDFNNDGLTDVYFCRRGFNQLWRQVERGDWQDVTEATGTAGGDFDTIDGVFQDLDHDGDLDLLLIRADGPTELLNNNFDGTFRAIAADQGLAGTERPSRGLLVADLDADRDADVVVIKREPPNEVFLNDRLWAYHPGQEFDALRQASILAAVAADVDADGQVEIYALSTEGLSRWQPDKSGHWQPSLIASAGKPAADPKLSIADLDGDGRLDALFSETEQLCAVRLVKPDDAICRLEAAQVGDWALANLRAGKGPSIVGLPAAAEPLVWGPGAGRYPFVDVLLSGKQEQKDQMRTNSSGLGVKLAVRIGSSWTAISSYRADSGPGQNLQPLALGLGGANLIDFVAVDWTDGVFQSEMELKPGKLRRIEETQRQVSSCPIVLAWDGSEFRFVTDVLGVGGLGFATGRGTYVTPRPREHLLLPPGLPAVCAGKLRLKIVEPMEEACYLDSAQLVAYDLPPGWQMTLDERMATAAPEATSRPIFFRQEQLPLSASNDRGEDVTALVSTADHHPAWPGRRDPRFLGRTERHEVLMTLAEPVELNGRECLRAEGWVEYPYSQTIFAAWQAGAAYDPPTLEACDESGQWHMVAERFGYPAGMPRQMVLPLPAIGPRVTQLRLSTNLELYWDRLALVRAEACPEARRQTCALTAARLAFVGFPRRTSGTNGHPVFDYGHRDPLWDTWHQRGWYTALGAVDPLVAECDSALAVFGPGEEVGVDFALPADPPPAGWTRRLVLELTGWCKDMDMMTRDGETVGPLPVQPGATPAQLEASSRLHERYHTRYESGR